MPIPFIVAGIAIISGGVGITSGALGAKKLYKANDKMKHAKERYDENISRFKRTNSATTESMDALGKKELEILSEFDEFSDLIEKIQNRPDFKEINNTGIELPKFNAKDLKDAGVGAGVLLGGLGGAAAGTAGGFAAAGATTAAVMAIGTASTGTAISTLSGVAATNATLAALGGGSIAAGGGGMALGATILSGATLGAGLLVGGIIFNLVGAKVSDKAEEAYNQMLKAENEINRCCIYMNSLSKIALRFNTVLANVNDIFKKNLLKLEIIVNDDNKTDWNTFTDGEKLVTQNTILLVQLLYSMCKTTIVQKDSDNNGYNEIQYSSVYDEIKKASSLAKVKGWSEVDPNAAETKTLFQGGMYSDWD